MLAKLLSLVLTNNAQNFRLRYRLQHFSSIVCPVQQDTLEQDAVRNIGPTMYEEYVQFHKPLDMALCLSLDVQSLPVYH